MWIHIYILGYLGATVLLLTSNHGALIDNMARTCLSETKATQLHCADHGSVCIQPSTQRVRGGMNVSITGKLGQEIGVGKLTVAVVQGNQ
jgi:hypothetical protein